MTRSANGFAPALRRGGARLAHISALLLGASAITLRPAQLAAEPTYALAMHGEPALPADFPHFRYANPDARKGGRLVEGVLGTFDNLNPFIVKGLSIDHVGGYVVESLMARNYDEPFTLYPRLAQSLETDEARSFVTFTIDPRARFSDGTVVTAQDVIFSWELLRDRGRPNLRTYYAKVTRAEAVGSFAVRFDLTGANDRELPLILGLMPVLPKHAVDPEHFEETSLTPPIGSGPYVIADVTAGRSVTLKRNPTFWGTQLAANRGLWNFDEIRLDFYRDANAQFEAFKRGLYDVRLETDPGRWETGYDIPAVRDHQIVREAFPTGWPQGMSAFVFNARRPIFADIRVREAIGRLFDFEWINRNFFFDAYERTASYFAGSELAANGRSADETERRLLEPFPNAVRPDELAGTWLPPRSDGSGRDRRALREALALLHDAGFDLDGAVLRRRATGEPLAFEILVTTKDQERLALALANDLKRAGIVVQVRSVDAVQYDLRRQTFDFDMIQCEWAESLSPGNEQSFYWGSAAADQPGSRNYMGARDPAIDAMIAAILQANRRYDLVAAVRALDRVLISGSYVVPLFHLPVQWVAHRASIEHPLTSSLVGYLPETWWRKP